MEESTNNELNPGASYNFGSAKNVFIGDNNKKYAKGTFPINLDQDGLKLLEGIVKKFSKLMLLPDEETHARVRCRCCNYSLCLTGNLTSDRHSKLRLGMRTDHLYRTQGGVMVQWFKNPAGYCFEVMTSTAASVKKDGEATEAHTWFQGFTWTVARCPKCDHHVGWVYNSTKGGATFYGLIVCYTKPA